jgi:LacI family transcriptional regulator
MQGDGERIIRQHRPGLVDVARAAGVSIATASRVVSGSSYPVSEARRRKVEEAVRVTGYVPDPAAQAMATGRTRTIGVIAGALSDPYFTEVTRGIEEAARRAGFLTILCSTDRDSGRELAYLRMLDAHRAAGAILVGGAFDDAEGTASFVAEAMRAKANGMRVIAMAQRPGLEAVRSVTIDDRAMLRDLASDLADLGHRTFAFVAPADGFSSAELRLDGLRQELAARHLPEPSVFRTGFDYSAGRLAALRMLASGIPDAAIGFSDESAIGMLMTFREEGVSVPDQVSVAGVDGTSAAEFLGMTTVSVPMYELGVAAANSIVGSAEGFEARRTVMPHRVVVRSTTARRNIEVSA